MQNQRLQSSLRLTICFVWLATFLSVAPTRNVLAQDLNEICPVLSPVADLIATPFRDSSGNYDIHVIEIDGSKAIRLTQDAAKDSSPSWSPDGDRLVFQSNRDGNWNLYSIRTDGADLVRLTDEPGRETHPSWSGDGSMIAFQTNRDGNSEVYVMSIDDRELIRITESPEFDGIPHWSPVDNVIAFSSRRTGSNDIFLYDRTTGVTKNVTNTESRDEYIHGWSPDGASISYWATMDNGEQNLFILNLEDGSPLQLTSGEALHRCPSFSRDGLEVVFASNLSGFMELYVISVDGSGERVLPLLNDIR